MNDKEFEKNYSKATLTIEIAVPKQSTNGAVEHSVWCCLDPDFKVFDVQEEKREAFK